MLILSQTGFLIFFVLYFTFHHFILFYFIIFYFTLGLMRTPGSKPAEQEPVTNDNRKLVFNYARTVSKREYFSLLESGLSDRYKTGQRRLRNEGG